jgi:Na+-exporting ATPase
VFVHKLGHGKPHLTHPRLPKLGLVKSRSRSTQRAPSAAPTGEKGAATASELERTVSAVESTHSDQGPLVKPGGHFEMVVEHPFDSTIKRMSTVWRFVPGEERGSEPGYVFVLMKCVLVLSQLPLVTCPEVNAE